MSLLLHLVRLEVWVFLLALAGIIAFQILSGRINTKGLLCGNGKKLVKSGPISPARVQLLLSTLGMAFYYLGQVMTNPTHGLPDVSASWPAVLGGSHAIYLGGKVYARFFGKAK